MFSIYWFDKKKYTPKENSFYFVIKFSDDREMPDIDEDDSICIAKWDGSDFVDYQHQKLWGRYFLPICDHIQPERSKREDSKYIPNHKDKYYIPERGPIECNTCLRPPCNVCN